MSKASRCAGNDVVETKYHPLHGNKRRKPEREASLQMCREIMSKWKAFLVPVGAGMLNVFVLLLLFFFVEAKIDTHGITCLVKNDSGLGHRTIIR